MADLHLIAEHGLALLLLGASLKRGRRIAERAGGIETGVGSMIPKKGLKLRFQCGTYSYLQIDRHVTHLTSCKEF